MALAVDSSGTTAALTIGVETVLATKAPGSPVTYVLRVDGNALATGEQLDIVVYTKTLTGGTSREEKGYRIGGDDDEKVCVTLPCPTDIEAKFGITQQNGTGRTFPWKLFTL